MPGRGDFPRREPRKPKKGAKKSKAGSLVYTPTTVEVVKKRKKPSEEEYG